jgi:phosphonate transport system substrate-binding protein
VGADLFRRRLIGGIGAVAGCLLVSMPPAGAQTPAGLRVGVLPNVSARVIFAHYQPMRAYLEATLGVKVEVLTAPDFKVFYARQQMGEYDLVIEAANIARLAEIDHRWVPFATYDPAIACLLVRSRGESPGGPAALKGKKLALANPQSLVALRGFTWLAERGLRRDVDYTTVQARNDDSLGTLLRGGEAPYAMMSGGEFRAIPEATRATLEVESEFAAVPAFALLLSPTLPADRAAAVKKALLDFGARPQGKEFFELSGVRALRALRVGELQSVDAFVAATRAALTP